MDEVVLIKRKDLIIARERRGHPDRPSRRIKSSVECTVTKRLDEPTRRGPLLRYGQALREPQAPRTAGK